MPANRQSPAKYLGYLAILAVGLGAIWFCVERGAFEYRLALDGFHKASEQEAKVVANTAGAALNQIYQNIRTISLLPSVRDIDRYGNNIDADARMSIQQIYNNIYSNLAVSEIHVTPLDFNPERIDPFTDKLEEPILMFGAFTDTVSRHKAEPAAKAALDQTGSETEGLKIYEYRELREQLARFRENFSLGENISGLEVPFINGAEVITCGNCRLGKTGIDADRQSLIFSVPFYGRDGQLKGSVSAIVRSTVLKNLMPGPNFALVDTRSRYVATTSFDGQAGASLEWVRKGLADPNLTASTVIAVPFQAPNSHWHLWMGRPETDFLGKPETKAVIEQRNISIGACLVIMALALASWGSLGRRRAAELAQWRNLSEATLEGLLICDGNTVVTSNGRFQAMIGVKDRALTGMRLEQVIADTNALARLNSESKEYIETRIGGATGAGIPVEILARPISYMGKPHRVLSIRDQSDLHEAEKKIRFLALRDALTGLANRNRFLDELRTTLKHLDSSQRFAVLCLDLDCFKNVNDTLGHGIGDQLLRTVAARLENAVRKTDLVARMGGDEFAIIQVASRQPETATGLALRLIEQLGRPYQIEGHQIAIGVSIGIAIAPSDGDAPEILLKNADLALYRAKSEGKQTFRLFEAEMDAKMQARRLLELELRQALDLGQLDLFYQPIVETQSRTTCGFEALLRWHHPTRGMVAPLDFVPLAEEIGLMGKIGAWVLNQACSHAMSWPETIRVAVNVSPAQFRGRSLELDVLAALGKSGLAAGRLEIEITESVLMEDTEASIAMLARLRQHGVRIAMDDFGTGYSSLSYLQKFPFDKIKIDQSFVRDSGTSSNSQAIIRAILGLANTFGMSTTAEGIETEEQMHSLSASGCSEFQGYLFSKPMRVSEIANFLKRDEKAQPRAV